MTAILFVASALGAWRYLTHQPLETNLRNMASTNAELHWGVALMDKFDRAFGHGISGGFALAVRRRDEVAPLVRKLRAADEGKPERQRLFSRVTTLDDASPPINQTSWRSWASCGAWSTASSATPTW